MTSNRERTAVYRLYDTHGVLLYVGSSNNPRHRYSEHSRSPLKPWWPQVTRKDETWYDTRTEAQAAESHAVKSEDPLHNVRLRPGAKTVTMATKLSEAQAAAIDAARGTTGRSTWLATVIRAALEAAQPTPANPPPKPAQRKQHTNPPPEQPKHVTIAPARQRCSHAGTRVIGGYCKECDRVVAPGGL